MSPERRAVDAALALYQDQSAGVRFHTRMRAWTAPLEAVLTEIPRTGRILDVGCGHGLVANAVALRDPGVSVLGVDVSVTKVASAVRTVGARTNVEFRLEPLDSVPERDFDAISLVDVLYLVPAAAWSGFLGAGFERLRRGGVFVLKEIGTAPRWKFERLKLQEFVSTRVIRITQGDVMHFESGDDLAARMRAAGFIDVRWAPLDRGYSSTHLVVTGRKP
jgi:cyclopropane fatty-acyl-phospholipid synthase-like methyltransferase